MADFGFPDEIRIFVITPEQQQFDFSLAGRDLVSRDVSPGGDLSIDFTVYGTVPYQDTLLEIGTHVVLEDKVGPFRSGYITGPTGSLPYRAGDIRLSARGYSSVAGLRRYEISTKFLTPTVGSAIIASRNQLCCPPLSNSNEYINLALLTNRSDGDSQDYVGSDALTIWNSYLALGTPPPDPEPLLWHVITAPDGLPTLQVDAVPAFARYQVRVPEGVVDNPSWALDDVDNQVVATYLDTEGISHTLVVNDPDNRLRFGLTGSPLVKSKSINLSGEFAASDAAQYAHTTIKRFSKVRLSGSSLEIPWGVQVTDLFTGEDVPLWRVRSGERIRVIVTPNDDPTGYLSEEERFISSTSWNGTTYALSLSTGDLRTETRQAQRRQTERSAAVLGNIPGLSKREPPPLQPREVDPQPLGLHADPGQSKYPASEGHIHPGPDPTDFIFHQFRVVAQDTGKGTNYSLEGCNITVPYACKVVGWMAVSDGPISNTVEVDFGSLASYPGHDFSFHAGIGGNNKGQDTLGAAVDLPAGSVFQFLPAGISFTDATFLTVTVVLKHTGSGWGP